MQNIRRKFQGELVFSPKTTDTGAMLPWFPLVISISISQKKNGSPNCPKIPWILPNDFWIYHFTHLISLDFGFLPLGFQRISSDFVVSGLCPKVVTNFWTGNSGPQEIWSLLMYKLPKKLMYIPAWDKENHRLGKGYFMLVSRSFFFSGWWAGTILANKTPSCHFFLQQKSSHFGDQMPWRCDELLKDLEPHIMFLPSNHCDKADRFWWYSPKRKGISWKWTPENEEEIHFRNCHYQVLPVSFPRVNEG